MRRQNTRIASALMAALLVRGGTAFSQAGGGFRLQDTSGTVHTAKEWQTARAVVLVFVITDCPITNSYVPELNRLQRDYAGRGVRFYAVQADTSVDAAQLRRYAIEYGYTFPLLLDPQLTLARRTGATVTPEAAALSPAGELLYLGRIDDRYPEIGKQRLQPTKSDLREALDAILAGKPVPQPRTQAIGCAIPKVR